MFDGIAILAQIGCVNNASCVILSEIQELGVGQNLSQ